VSSKEYSRCTAPLSNGSGDANRGLLRLGVLYLSYDAPKQLVDRPCAGLDRLCCSDGYAVGAGSFSDNDGCSVASCDTVLHSHCNDDCDGYRASDVNLYTVPDCRSPNRDADCRSSYRNLDRRSTNRDTNGRSANHDADTFGWRPVARSSGFPHPS
jgi:hypothetical protein